MAASKDILFWTPRGQLLRNQRIIPVTNISELVEYVLLPHNDKVIKPRAFNTFLDGLAELGVDKKILSNLLEKEKDYRENQERIIRQEFSKPCHHCQNWNMSVTAVSKCPRCFWHDNNSICPVTFVVTTSRLTTNI